MKIIKSHFLFLRLISTKRVSISQLELYIRILDGISSVIHNRSPPPLETGNWDVGNESSSLVSEIKNMFMLLSMVNFNASNLFRFESEYLSSINIYQSGQNSKSTVRSRSLQITEWYLRSDCRWEFYTVIVGFFY